MSHLTDMSGLHRGKIKKYKAQLILWNFNEILCKLYEMKLAKVYFFCRLEVVENELELLKTEGEKLKSECERLVRMHADEKEEAVLIQK